MIRHPSELKLGGHRLLSVEIGSRDVSGDNPLAVSRRQAEPGGTRRIESVRTLGGGLELPTDIH
ncbi:MAG: hypothetical protein ABEN55_04935 [Bradymonadaceae bacterium]